VAGPIVFVSHFRIKTGHEDEFQEMANQVIPNLDATKPRTAFQHFYLDKDGTSVSIVHVFPDSEAFDLHMEGASDRTQAAMEFLEPIGFELYGEPTESFMAAMGDASGMLRIEPTHMGGYDRL
jgi:hypothetical protein